MRNPQDCVSEHCLTLSISLPDAEHAAPTYYAPLDAQGLSVARALVGLVKDAESRGVPLLFA